MSKRSRYNEDTKVKDTEDCRLDKPTQKHNF